jgi:IclR family transcriptional regulator, KDG regulon repressor
MPRLGYPSTVSDAAPGRPSGPPAHADASSSAAVAKDEDQRERPHVSGRVPGDGPVTKSLMLLDAFAEAEQPLRFSDLKGRLPFPKATLHRMLKSLVDERMLTHNETTGSYQLGPRLIRLAHAAWAHGSLSDAARPILDKLHAELGKTIHLAQLDNGQVLYLDKRIGNRGLAMFSRPGKVGPAYCTGVGKAMMAYLPDDALEDCLHRQTLARFTATTLTSRTALLTELEAIRQRGHGYDREEHEPGIICIAVPILSTDGALFGGLSATSPGTVKDIDSLEDLAPTLKEAARIIAADATMRMAPTLT